MRCCLVQNGQVWAHTQHILPFTLEAREDGEVAELYEDGQHIYAQGEGFRYVFSKHYGTFVSLQMGGAEQITDLVRLTACRAPTDNDRNVQYRWLQLDEWRGENLDKSFTKVYECGIQGNAIVLRGSLSGISRTPLLRYTQRVRIFQDGSIQWELEGNVRKDAFWLPRLGYEFTLPEQNSAFRYYGNGPMESYRDLCHAGYIGLHHSTAAEEYVPYVRPQEHGNHTAVKALQIGHMVFEGDFEANVSCYSTEALLKAEHTDELQTDGRVHLRIDYKVSGIGSNSCGPSLEPKYRLDEKQIRFRFRIRPAK